MEERLQKLLAQAGLCSRREAERWIDDGRVTVNGKKASVGDKADPRRDKIFVDGKPIGGAEEKVYLMLYKPRGYVTTMKDEHGRKTVADLVRGCGARVVPVGRLDYNSEGLLLLTNDGELLHRLISPKKEVPKVYYARHQGTAGPEDIEAFLKGILLRDGTCCLPAELCPLGPGESQITVCEGKYHQVRRMMAARNMTVTYLERRREGNLELGNLPRGQVRLLEEGEIRELEALCGM